MVGWDGEKGNIKKERSERIFVVTDPMSTSQEGEAGNAASSQVNATSGEAETKDIPNSGK